MAPLALLGHSLCHCTAPLCALGAFLVLRFAVTFLGGVYRHFLRPGKNLASLGEWAIVTGATDGIGKGMAMELARKGLSIILISRTPERLTAVAEEIKAKCPKVQVESVAVDFSDFSSTARDSVAAAVKGKTIAVLVNNVGVSYPFPKYFRELQPEQVHNLIELNVNSTTWMTYLVLPSMMERRRGAVVNIASVACEIPSPLLAQYSAAKSYIKLFSESLAVECASFNVSVQCQVPLFVATKLAKIRATSLTVPSPAAYARTAVAAIGYESVISPYWAHALQLWVMSVMPSFVRNMMVMSTHQDLRRRGMKKEEGKKAE